MRDLTEVFDPSLRLPIRGREYIIPAPDAATGLRLSAIYALSMQAVALASIDGADDDTRAALARSLTMTDAQETNWHVMALTQPVIDQMTADNVPQPYIDHAAETAWIHWSAGADASEAYWESGGKAVPARRRMNPSPSTSTGEASTTPSPGSGTGTTSHPKSKPGKHAKQRKRKG